jgi:hypothetical protein
MIGWESHLFSTIIGHLLEHAKKWKTWNKNLSLKKRKSSRSSSLAIDNVHIHSDDSDDDGNITHL